MTASRRDFLKLLGVSLVSVLARGCASKSPTPDNSLTPSCYQATAPPFSVSVRLETIRSCWLRLAESADADQTIDWVFISRQHRSALDDLVAGDVLAPAVAEDVQSAFDQAVAHIERSQVTCYIALPAVYYPRQDLLAQISLLEQMQTEAALDPAAVAKVEAALTADIRKFDDLAAGGTPAPVETADADETAQAAGVFLTTLLLGNRPN